MNLRALKRDLTARFVAAGLPFAQDDAAELLLAATGLTDSELIIHGAEPITDQAAAILDAFVARRLSGEPVDHILGWREFYGRRFKINKDVLSPRADTECLVREALKVISDINAPRILDLGTGSGAILITLLSERRNAIGTATDLSGAALAIAKENAKTHQVTADWYKGSWFTALPTPQQFDLIVSNPPYITASAMTELETEVKEYDPDLALRGGEDGLEAYHAIIRDAAQWLTHQGWLGIEIGYDQGASVQALFTDAGFKNISLHQDLSGQDRVIMGQSQS